VIERNITRLAEHNRGSHIGEAHRARIIESNRTRTVSPESHARRSAATRRLWAEGKASPRVGTGRRGKRADLGGTPFRSSWEANVARIFTACGIEWEFEPQRFTLTSGQTYAPDFRLGNGTYIEVKGYWRPEARARFDAFRAEYPVTVHVIDQHRYQSMEARWSRTILNWERARAA
jgi:predicted nuclease of restriction endonuclease-like RecB superfamily